ncbi:MAG TPA: glycosyltransferase family 4 protein [Methylomirabilota bacterium]|nr:glycosyltransferase family 4 protein [Methylomirabilota bacterium]
MLGPWVPSARYPVEAERLLHFARMFAGSHQLTLGFATDVVDPSGTVSAMRAEFDDIEFATLSRPLQRLRSAARLATGGSVDLTYFDSPALRTRLRDRLRAKPFDLVYAASAGMIQYALALPAAVPLVIDFGELDSKWWAARAHRSTGLRAALYRREAARVRRFEKSAARRGAILLASSPGAAERISGFAPSVPVAVIPNGVDPDRHAGSHRAAKPVIVLTGGLEEANGLDAAVELCQVIFPAVRLEVSHARLLIHASLLPRGARHLGRLPGVEIIANGGDFRTLLRHAAVAVTSGGDSNGGRHAVLEAMAAGVPVVVSRRGRGNLDGQANREVYIEDEPEALTQRLIRLLTNETLRAEAGRRGQAFVRTHHSWDTAAARLAQALENVLGIQSVTPPHAAGTSR